MGCHSLLQGIFQPRDQTHVSGVGRQILYNWATRGKSGLKKDLIHIENFPNKMAWDIKGIFLGVDNPVPGQKRLSE